MRQAIRGERWESRVEAGRDAHGWAPDQERPTIDDDTPAQNLCRFEHARVQAMIGSERSRKDNGLGHFFDGV